MSESQITCIVDVHSGIDNASPQISKFTHDFDCIKFIANKNFTDYSVVIITDASGRINIVPEGDNLKKSYNSEENKTELLWYPQRQITCDDGVVIYQIAAYSTDDDKSVWYSKEGRLIVTNSIDTNDLSAELIGSSPNLIEQILTEIKKSEIDLENAKIKINTNSRQIADIVSDVSEIENDVTHLKTTLHNGESTYNPDSELAQSGRAVAQAVASIVDSAPETLNTLKELSRALGDDPNFATTIMALLGNKLENDVYYADLGSFYQKFTDIEDGIYNHTVNDLNPHDVTKKQVGLGNVDNTSDKDKPLSDIAASEFKRLDNKYSEIKSELDTAVYPTLNNKVNKVDGKGLSSNDFTDEYVQMVNENNYIIGNVSDLKTDNVDTLVDAVNELYDEIHEDFIYYIPPTLLPNKEYSFGMCDNLKLVFPSVAQDGDVIYLTFKSGDVPAALTIDTTNTCDIEIIPEANTGYEIFGKYIDSVWVLDYSEYVVSGV